MLKEITKLHIWVNIFKSELECIGFELQTLQTVNLHDVL